MGGGGLGSAALRRVPCRARVGRGPCRAEGPDAGRAPSGQQGPRGGEVRRVRRGERGAAAGARPRLQVGRAEWPGAARRRQRSCRPPPLTAGARHPRNACSASPESVLDMPGMPARHPRNRRSPWPGKRKCGEDARGTQRGHEASGEGTHGAPRASPMGQGPTSALRGLATSLGPRWRRWLPRSGLACSPVPGRTHGPPWLPPYLLGCAPETALG